MQLIPAIDLMNGRIVRLTRGDQNTAKIYTQFGTPAQAAKKWQEDGAKKIHIIDLDATFGLRNNRDVIAEIAWTVDLPIQVGGGIRSIKVAEKLFQTGISQVILGSLAFSDPSVIGRIQEKFGEQSVIVALDNKDGKIMVEGWKTTANQTVTAALEKFSSLGVHRFLITSITKDGMLQGPDVENIAEACRRPSLKIIAAGGISSINDLSALKKVGVEGVVIGKALYENKFTLKEALKKLGD